MRTYYFILPLFIMLSLTSILTRPISADENFTPTQDDINTWRYGALILPEDALIQGAPAVASELLENEKSWAKGVKNFSSQV